jgi:hypothetical protein
MFFLSRRPDPSLRSPGGRGDLRRRQAGPPPSDEKAGAATYGLTPTTRALLYAELTSALTYFPVIASQEWPPFIDLRGRLVFDLMNHIGNIPESGITGGLAAYLVGRAVVWWRGDVPAAWAASLASAVACGAVANFRFESLGKFDGTDYAYGMGAALLAGGSVAETFRRQSRARVSPQV